MSIVLVLLPPFCFCSAKMMGNNPFVASPGPCGFSGAIHDYMGTRTVVIVLGDQNAHLAYDTCGLPACLHQNQYTWCVFFFNNDRYMRTVCIIAPFIYPLPLMGIRYFLPTVTYSACFPCSSGHTNSLSTISQLHNHAPKRRRINAWYI